MEREGSRREGGRKIMEREGGRGKQEGGRETNVAKKYICTHICSRIRPEHLEVTDRVVHGPYVVEEVLECIAG